MKWVNELYEGDCVELMIRMPKDHVDLAITSPPYDDLRSYHNNLHVPTVAFCLHRVLKPGGIVVWVTGDKTHKGSETLSSFKHAIAFKEAGFNVHDTMIYAKENPIPMNHNRYEQVFEYMFVFAKGKPKTFNPIRTPITSPRPEQQDVHHTKNYQRGNKKRGHNTTKIKGNIWSYKVGLHCSTKDVEAFQHPAIFPDQLAEDHILSWTEPGDLVLDPMCGSGTSCKMAVKHGRKYLGFDIESRFVELARQRILSVK